METYHGIGLMSGTSLDGLDIAWCKFTHDNGTWSFELLEAEAIDFEDKWRDRLACVMDQAAEIYAKTNVYFGHYLGKVIRDFIDRHKIQPQFVASHGQTIFHQPEKSFTAQIGDGETMAAQLPCPLITNFRNKDVAAGGQGAPLVPFGEKWLFPNRNLFLNLGGFANVTVGETAFDVSACNLVLNRLASLADPELTYDPDGRIARSGKWIPSLGAALDNIPFYRRQPPKTLGAEWLESAIWPVFPVGISPIPDMLFTYCRHLAGQIARAITSLGVKDEKIVISGGGARNAFLMEEIEMALGAHGILKDQDISQEIGDFKEAILFAFLGLMTLLGKPNSLSSVTGANEDICGGSIHLPRGGWNNPFIKPV